MYCCMEMFLEGCEAKGYVCAVSAVEGTVAYSMNINDNWMGEAVSESAKKLHAFLPEKIYDAHVHLFDPCVLPGNVQEEVQQGEHPEFAKDRHEQYTSNMRPFLGTDRHADLHFFLNPTMNSGDMPNENTFIEKELKAHPGSTAEILVHPGEDYEAIVSRLIHPRIRGLKCYHTLLHHADTFHAQIEEFLPESAWQAASDQHLVITLHMVKDDALADPDNMRYIKKMAAAYPDAILNLAHCARAFASWTGVETVEELKPYENIRFDFAAVCESPAMFMLLKKIGVSRCMWGSDYPISMLRGKAISIADTFYWISGKDIEGFSSATQFHSWLVAAENLMAVRQACLMADLSCSEIEDLFYHNASRLFHRERGVPCSCNIGRG